MLNLKLLSILLLLTPLISIGQGLPIIQNYKATKYGGAPQNWDIYIDQNNIVYFSHNGGISTFDGTKWEHFKNSNKSHIRCLSLGFNNLLFAGGNSEFGYFEPNLLGELEYKSLMDKFKDKQIQFSDIWSIAATSTNVAFTIRDKVLLYNMDSIETIKTNCKAVRVFNIFDNILLFSKSEGILKLSGTKFFPLPELDRFAKDNYILITEFTNKKILIASETSGIWVYDYKAAITNQKQPYLKRIKTGFENKISEELLSDIEYDTTSSTIHICTMKTLLSVDTLGYTKRIIGYEQGLVDNGIISIKPDKLGNLWVGADNGVSYIHMASPLLLIDNRLGGAEHPHDILFENDYSYFTNISGLSITKTENLFSLPQKPLQHILNDQNGAWAIHSTGDKTFISMGFDIIEVSSGKVKSKVLNKFAYSITDYSKKDKKLFIGGIDKSHIADIKRGYKTQQIDSLSGSIKRAIGVNEYHVVAEALYKGVFNLYQNISKKNVIQWIDKTLGFSPNVGSPVLMDSTVYICASNGLYKVLFNEDNSVDTVFIDNDFMHISEFNSGIMQIIHDTAADGYWASTEKGLLFIKNKQGKPHETIKSPFRIVPEIHQLVLLKNYLVVLSTDGICFYDKNKSVIDTIGYKTVFREIKFDNDEVFRGYYSFNTNSNRHIHIDNPINYEKNKLKVSFSSPYYYYQDSIKYECILENFDKDWIELNSKTEKEYTNIPPGKYCFKVRAINVFGNKSESSDLYFSIATPWYRSSWIKILYIILGILFIMVIIKIYTYRLKLVNERLEKTVQSRSKELQMRAQNISEQNEKIKSQNAQILEQSKELERANKQLSQLSVVVQQTDNGVLIIKRPNVIQYINNGMIKMLDLENDSQIDKYINDNILARIQTLSTILDETFNTLESVAFESIVTTFQDRKKWLQITVSPVYDSDVQTNKVVIVCTDISLVKLAEEEISQQREELFSQSELLESTNIELEKANQLMRNSITYAQRIQNATHPDINEIKEVFTDTFIFFKPKDIVSGDFYWFSKTNNTYIMIVADCTGHGVPGAFMSMIGYTLLKEYVLSKKIHNPAQILSYLNEGIRTILRQKDKADDIQDDGMDMTVCIYDLEFRRMQIALANHRALLIKKDEINIIDGDLFSVGGSLAHRASTQYSFKRYSIESGDILYMYSDGFQDQLGGKKYSKYGSSEFLRYLTKISKESFDDQAAVIEEEYNKWKNNRNQTDDILIWGIEF